MKLSIQNLQKTYPNGVRALKGIDLVIETGMFGLLGPNGAGKSSLMRTIATLQEADAGSIFLDDLDVLNDKPAVRRILGYLPQEFGVYPKISSEVMLDHIAQLKGILDAKERKQTVAALLARVNLYNDRKKHLGTFSGGMKQRFGIAQALLANPKLIIVDEPTAGLDPAERNRFYNLLSELGENTIVILSTHIVEDVRTLCSDFAIICKGEVLRNGNPDEAVKELEGYIYSITIEKSDIEEYKAKYQVISAQMKSGKLSIRIFSETDPGIGFLPVEPILEDIYFHQIASKMDVIAL
ncbi:ABC transporter ATP-binding protein [Dyadobacter sp. CY323]|uniref:ABC transporter ATP-binding protein n=1 Tax=Dyadobacter sp. CY323 TaxID=2907302 RepID=UPI001F214FE2|nr:ABC transporter ATP-binding protein [Dyadobacter sp. CY323]MCE6990737.1 ABC transporter ATP-binding protein [Dyadobacter sp. CY323]